MSRCIIWHISGWHWYFCDNVLNPRWPPWDMGKCHGLFILIANCIFSLQRMLYERCSGRKIRDRPVKSPLAARVPRVSCDLIQTWLYNFDWRILRLFLTVQPSILPVINPVWLVHLSDISHSLFAPVWALTVVKFRTSVIYHFMWSSYKWINVLCIQHYLIIDLSIIHTILTC